MNGEREPEAGTQPPPDDGENAGTQEGADDGEAAAGEDDKVAISKGELGVWKSKAERVNAVEAENARLKAQIDARDTTDNRAPADDEDDAFIAEIDAAAKGGDKASKAFMAGLRRAERLNHETRSTLEMARIPEDRHAAVQEFMRKNGVKSPAIANQFLLGGEAGALKAKVADLEAQLKTAKAAPPNVERPVRGESRVAASTTVNGAKPVTLAKYRELMADPATMHETKKARDGGKLFIRD